MTNNNSVSPDNSGAPAGDGKGPDSKIPKDRSFKEDFRSRLSNVSTGRWVRFGIVSLILLFFVFWISNWWLLLIWLLLFDIYITCYIPWTWWKSLKGPGRMVMGWIDAIVYALILVYIIFAFIGQNYTIPSSSLEKSLLVGDFLWVNKAVYGPRVPNTPVHFPLAHNTMPVIGGKSYLESPSLSYHRLPGLRSVERGDIVVFNYPEGDSTLVGGMMPFYYEVAQNLKEKGISDPAAEITAHPEIYGELVVNNPVDRRENYVKRVIGLPGEMLKIVDDIVYIDGKPLGEADRVQYNYVVPVNRPIEEERWMEIGVSKEDLGRSFQRDMEGNGLYILPLTSEMLATVKSWPEVELNGIQKYNTLLTRDSQRLWPVIANYGWTHSNMSEFWIPKRGSTLRLTLNNLPLYQRAITRYEGNDLKVKDGRIYINDKPADYYTFKYDYYWMMGDNRDNSYDSRFFGLVPEDHVIGQPMIILASFDKDRSLFNGGFRWDRVLRNPNPDKDKAKEKNWN